MLLSAVLSLGTAAAQDLSNMSPDQIKQLMQKMSPEERQRLQGAQSQGGATPISPGQSGALQQVGPGTPQRQPLVMSPAPSNHQGETAVSGLERIMSDRTGHDIRLFGYDQLGVGQDIAIPEMGAVQDNYILGPGDKIVVTLRGQENSDYSVVVDRNGQITLPKLGPIMAAGRNLAAFRQAVISAARRTFFATDIFVTIDQLRQVAVLVSGEVGNPGTRIVTGLSSPLDAILLSGGIKKSGSLRDVQLIRNGQATPIDLYGVLTRHGRINQIFLRDGDRLLVPPIGSTIAVSGAVRRPAIYEMPPGQQAMAVRDAVALADGPEIRGVYTVSLLRILPNGTRQYVDVSDRLDTRIRDGEVIILKSAADISIDRVTLEGAVRTPGAFAIGKFRTLHDLLPNADALAPDAYVLFGFIDRIDPATLQHTLVPFSVVRVIRGLENTVLASGDSVHILTVEGMRKLAGGATAEPSDQPEQAAAVIPSSVPLGAVPADGAGAIAGGDAAAAPQGDADLGGYSSGDAMLFGGQIGDYRVTLNGAVHRPGVYLVAPNTTLAEAIVSAGGLDSDVDLKGFDLTSTTIDNATGTSVTTRKTHPATQAEFGSVVLHSYDRVEFRHVYADREGGTVAIEGEVHYPGSYDILRSERLSSLLARVGGLTDLAYPLGTVFMRKSVADQEAAENRRNVSDLRSQLFMILSRPRGATAAPPAADSVAALEALLAEMEKLPAVGRVSILADPAELARHPERDPILQPGDRIVIPKRPSSVMVLGEVLRPGSFPIDTESSVGQYVDDAGGLTQFADSSRVIVVLPNGMVRSGNNSWLSFGLDDSIPPGSVIVVPRDMTGLSIHQLIVDTTQIFSQLATTAAALAVLSKY